jgi:hypothetical protein
MVYGKFIDYLGCFGQVVVFVNYGQVKVCRLFGDELWTMHSRGFDVFDGLGHFFRRGLANFDRLINILRGNEAPCRF